MKAKDIITAMGWNYDDTESSARMVAEHCANKMYSEEEVLKLVSDWTDYRMSEDTKSKVTFKKYLEQFKKK